MWKRLRPRKKLEDYYAVLPANTLVRRSSMDSPFAGALNFTHNEHPVGNCLNGGATRPKKASCDLIIRRAIFCESPIRGMANGYRGDRVSRVGEAEKIPSKVNLRPHRRRDLVKVSGNVEEAETT